MKTKEDLIRAYWGGSYGIDVDENGWKPIYNSFIPSTLEVDISICGNLYRPKTLRGIDHNNGWIAIKCENDLPKSDDLNSIYNVITTTGKILIAYPNSKYPNSDTDVFCKYGTNHRIYGITHYQKIEKPKMPLY